MSDEVVKFYCIECDKEYPLDQQFSDKPICITCAEDSGVKYTLESEKELEQGNESDKPADTSRYDVSKELESFVCTVCNQSYSRAKNYEGQAICIHCAETDEAVNEISEQVVESSNLSVVIEMLSDDNDAVNREGIQDKELLHENSLLKDNIEMNSNEKAAMTDKTTKRNELKIEGTDWVDLPSGEFLMGSPMDEQGRGDDEGLHRVELDTFKIMATAVTFEQYDSFCQATGRELVIDKGWGRAKRPVIYVSYWDAVDYAKWLSEQTGWHCRLPTEAEWEYACRCGSNTPFNTGEGILGGRANYDGLYTYVGGIRANSRWMTMPVGSFPANIWGLYDMHGNVWEWCASEYDADYSGLEQMDASLDRMNNIPRSLRGGSWHSRPALLRSAYRYRFLPDDSSYEWGFRLVRVEP